jgi:hypothetical protein
MSGIKQIILSALVAASVIVLSPVSAEARGGYFAVGGPYAYQPHYAFPPVRHYYAYQAYGAHVPFYGEPGFYYSRASTGYFGSGTFSNGRRVPSTNYNPNQ